MISKRAFQLRKKDGKPNSECICRTPELIENYKEAISDITQVWICHHRNEKFYTSKELIDLGLYYDCPSCELIFVTKSEHNKIYHKGISGDESRRKNSDNHKGNQNNLGKKRTESAKEKIRNARIGQKASNETKNKMSKSRIGRHWYNDGTKSVFVYECPPGFVPGRL